MNKKISVIIPIYNTEKYLNRCIDSIISQSYTNLEIILVDDGSTDSCVQICDDFAKKDDRIKVIHKQNGGQSSARNAGLDIATGDYIGFVDSDDYILQDMYERLIDAIEKDEFSVASIMFNKVDSDGRLYPSKVAHPESVRITAKDYVKELMLKTGDESVCTKLFSRDIFNDLRFNEGTLNEDFLFMLKATEKFKTLSYIGELGYYYYIRGNSVTAKYGKAFIDMVQNSRFALEYVIKRFPDLEEYALSHALYQHMVYMRVIPKAIANNKNEIYKEALLFIRKNLFAALSNKYLKIKTKILIFAIAAFPELMAATYLN